MRILTIIISLFSLLNSYTSGSSDYTFIIRTDTVFQFNIMAYNGFDSFQIKDTSLNSGSVFNIETSYRGFALLEYSTGQQYPLIISDQSIEIELNHPDKPPVFKNSPENDFLYKWLSTYKQNERVLFSLQDKINKPDTSDTLLIKSELYEIEKMQQKHIETLTNNEHIYASTVLRARLLNESTYKIKTIDELNDKKEEYYQFINENYEILQHSDMLIQLAKQYFMMHEYISYINENSDLKQAKILYQEYIISGVQDWINVLQNRIHTADVIEFCARLYYDRSMITQATRIFDYYRDALVTENVNYLFPIKKQLPDFEFVNTKRLNKQKINKLKTKKIVSIISVKSVFSKVETISLARTITDCKMNIPMVIIPIEELSNSHFVMDRMFTGEFYFMDDEEWQKKYLTGKISLPQFYLLDEKNKIIIISINRNEIIKTIIDESF